MADESPTEIGQRDQEHFSVHPGYRFGKPCLRGTRITPADVIGYLASGMTVEEVLDDFPELTREHVLASLRFAAEATRREEQVISRASWWTQEGANERQNWEKLKATSPEPLPVG